MKTTKRTVPVLQILIPALLFIFFIHVPVHADMLQKDVDYEKKIYISIPKDFAKCSINVSHKYPGFEVSSMKSNNEKVIKPWLYNLFEVKKKGKATLTLEIHNYTTDETKTIKTKVYVRKYENPIKTMKIGKKKAKVKYSGGLYINQSVKGKNIKVSFKLKKNWKALYAYRYVIVWDDAMANKYHYKLQKYKLSKIPVQGDSQLFIMLKNKKTKVKEPLLMNIW